MLTKSSITLLFLMDIVTKLVGCWSHVDRCSRHLILIEIMNYIIP